MVPFSQYDPTAAATDLYRMRKLQLTRPDIEELITYFAY